MRQRFVFQIDSTISIHSYADAQMHWVIRIEQVFSMMISNIKLEFIKTDGKLSISKKCHIKWCY